MKTRDKLKITPMEAKGESCMRDEETESAHREEYKRADKAETKITL